MDIVRKTLERLGEVNNDRSELSNFENNIIDSLKEALKVGVTMQDAVDIVLKDINDNRDNIIDDIINSEL